MARSRKRKKVLGQVQRLEIANIQGFHPVFHERDLRPLFYPLSALFFERKHSFVVLMVSQNFPKPFKSCPRACFPARKKTIYIPGKRSYIPGHIIKLFHFALSLKLFYIIYNITLVFLDFQTQPTPLECPHFIRNFDSYGFFFLQNLLYCLARS